MKTTLTLLSAVLCLAAPSALRAAPKTKSRPLVATAARPAPPRNQTIFYIMDTPRTGSNIPMVYRRYHGRIDSASSAAVYGQEAINSTGAFDVGAALYRIDPSFTISRGR